jgi:hypothetical protein
MLIKLGKSLKSVVLEEGDSLNKKGEIADGLIFLVSGSLGVFCEENECGGR